MGVSFRCLGFKNCTQTGHSYGLPACPLKVFTELIPHQIKQAGVSYDIVDGWTRSRSLVVILTFAQDGTLRGCCHKVQLRIARSIIIHKELTDVR